jgi:hypothetical protein
LTGYEQLTSRSRIPNIRTFSIIQMNLNYEDFSDKSKESLWSKLDDELDSTFDFAKIVIYEIDEDDAREHEWESLEPVCWVNRQDKDSPYDALIVEEVKWLAKHLGNEEAELVAKDFGDEGTQTAIVYAMRYSDDEDIEPARCHLSSFTRSSDSE